MCERAIQLQKYIDEWLKQEITLKSNTTKDVITQGRNIAEADSRDLMRLRLSSTEWRHLELITTILKRFKTATDSLSVHRTPQIQYTWLMYNRLFDFFDEMEKDLTTNIEYQEDTEWPLIVRTAVKRGQRKLSKYYGKTENQRGLLFNCATILDPTQKLSTYEVLYHGLLSRFKANYPTRKITGNQDTKTNTTNTSSAILVDMTVLTTKALL